MAYKLIGQDQTVTITLGGAATGAAPSYSGGAAQLANLKSLSIDESVETTDVSALGDGLKKLRVRRSSAKLKVDLLVPSTGRQFANYVGYYVKVEHKALSSLGSTIDYEGIITAVNYSAPDGEQTESLEIEVGADGATYSGAYA
jgi:hypothetical protein